MPRPPTDTPGESLAQKSARITTLAEKAATRSKSLTHATIEASVGGAPATIASMVADAYGALADQIRQCRESSRSKIWQVNEASTLQKLISCLTALQEMERRNAHAANLSHASDEDLEQMVAEAAQIVAKNRPR